MFFQDLNEALLNIRAESQPKDESEDVFIQYKFKKTSSYTNTSSVGPDGVKIDPIKREEIEGKNLIIIEDMYDTGNSMAKMVSNISAKDPKCLKVCVLLHKKNSDNQINYGYKADYIGFWCPDSFIIGYGMDYNEYFRDFRHIGIIAESAIEKFKNWDKLFGLIL